MPAVYPCKRHYKKFVCGCNAERHAGSYEREVCVLGKFMSNREKLQYT